MRLDRTSGVFTIGDYVFSPHLTYRDLETTYKLIRLTTKHIPTYGTTERIYRLPKFAFDEHQLEGDLVFVDEYVSGIYLRRVYSRRRKVDYWITQLIDWCKAARNWLYSQLGEPECEFPSVLFDERDRFSAEEIEALRCWEYIFEWGHVGFYYDGLQEPGDIFVHFNYHYRIRTWDELLLDIERYLSLPQSPWLNWDDNFPALKSAINQFKQHFNYFDVLPMFVHSGLQFNMKERSRCEAENSYPILIEIDIHRLSGTYRVSRPDLVQRAYTNDLDKLIEQVRAYISGINLT